MLCVYTEIPAAKTMGRIFTLSRPMKVATPMFCSLRKVTHFWAVSMVSTTMLSRAPQLEEIATSYFSSMAPRSPYKKTIIHLRRIHVALCSPGDQFGLKISFTSQQNNWLNCGAAACIFINPFFTSLPKMPGILPVFFCCMRASRTFPRLRLEDRELLASSTFCLISLTTFWVSVSNFISCPSWSSSCAGKKRHHLSLNMTTFCRNDPFHPSRLITVFTFLSSCSSRGIFTSKSLMAARRSRSVLDVVSSVCLAESSCARAVLWRLR